MVPEHVQLALDQTKIGLMSREDSVFFSTVVLSLKHVWDNSIPTAGVDGISIFYNPDFFMELSKDERVFLLLHETMHVVYQHITRKSDRDHDKWNRAGDYVINASIIKMGLPMPKGGLYDAKYTGMTTDQVYDLLDDEPMPAHLKDIREPKEAPEEVQKKIDEILVRASIQSRASGDKPGTIPGEVEIYLKSLLDPILPWYRILHKHMNALAKTEYSFMRPNRRFFPDHILPTAYGTGLENIAVAIDTSGSVTDSQFQQFCSEAGGILKNLQPEKVTITQFDHRLQSVDEVRSLRDIHKVKFTGRGGTNVDTVMNWANENKPNAMVVFTDGYFRRPGIDPGIPVYWIIHSNKNFSCAFGKVIKYDVKEGR